MKQILLLAKNDGEINTFRKYLVEKLSSYPDLRFSCMKILVNNCQILIKPNTENCYRGMKPNYHYAYGSKANEYLLANRSKRLHSLDDVVDIVKGEIDV